MAISPRIEPEQFRPLVDELVAIVGEYDPDAETAEIRRAFAFAAERHAGQQRKSGEPFVLHPLGVAKICAQLRQQTPVVVAALLHDVVEDTETTSDELRSEFGEEVAQLVEGVTKLSRIQFASREEAQAENYRKMILSMARDVRVIVLKLADRLHNMRTLAPLSKQKQLQTSKETLEV